MSKMKISFGILILLILVLGMNGCEKSLNEPATQTALQFLKIHLYYGFGNELNTFEQTYTKDLVMDGYITVSFWLNEEEQQSILNKLRAVDFFHFPDTIMYRTDSGMYPDPGWQFLRVSYENKDKTVYWRYPLPEGNEFVPLLLDLINLIIDIIKSKPEYKALPPARGGRL